MKKLICLLLACSVFLAGCAGREANLVQVRQLGDEQKTCDDLRSELYYIENEISRLLPKSDKTGRNIALGATGILFIVPLFFMDLKQGEKKEIEAYRQRYNHLLMITQLKDCKLPTAVTEETVERIPSIEERKAEAKKAKKEAGNTKTKEETKTISQKEYDEYQRYLEEQKNNESQPIPEK